jgi:hypothetical protein
MMLDDWLYLLSRAVDGFLYYKQRAAVKKVVGFNPRKQNRAEGVIFWFYELRMTRAELIKGYEMNAQRIPLRGLTATITGTDTVDVTIKGEPPRCTSEKCAQAAADYLGSPVDLFDYHGREMSALPTPPNDNLRSCSIWLGRNVLMHALGGRFPPYLPQSTLRPVRLYKRARSD